jgi:hypothetical protein
MDVEFNARASHNPFALHTGAGAIRTVPIKGTQLLLRQRQDSAGPGLHALAHHDWLLWTGCQRTFNPIDVGTSALFHLLPFSLSFVSCDPRVGPRGVVVFGAAQDRPAAANKRQCDHCNHSKQQEPYDYAIIHSYFTSATKFCEFFLLRWFSMLGSRKSS